MGLTNETYFDKDEFMSVSLFKKLMHCEEDGLTDFGTPSSSMLVGSYVDAYVEGTLDTFIEEHPEIVSSRGATKGELKAEFKKAEEICRFIDGDETIQQFLSGEKQRIMTGVINGVPFKIKMDAYSEGIAINDLKVMYTITDGNGNYIDFITKYGYDIQLAVYQEIVRQNTGLQLPCFIVAVTKEDVIDSAIINIPQDVLDRALGLVDVLAPHLYDVKMGKVQAVGCGKCATCKSKRKKTPIISMEEFYVK